MTNALRLTCQKSPNCRVMRHTERGSWISSDHLQRLGDRGSQPRVMEWARRKVIERSIGDSPVCDLTRTSLAM